MFKIFEGSVIALITLSFAAALMPSVASGVIGL